MISSRRRAWLLAAGVLPGAVAFFSRRAVARQAAPPAKATPGAATPAARGRYRLPNDPTATVISVTFGNGSLPPEYQYGYDVTIDASGHAVVTISPVGSRDASSAGAAEQAVELGEVDLRALLAELDALGFFALPQADPSKRLIGGEVDEIDVTLADGEWQVDAWSLEGDGQQARFAAAHEVILRAVGLEQAPDLGQ